jgi:hypothetical protein
VLSYNYNFFCARRDRRSQCYGGISAYSLMMVPARTETYGSKYYNFKLF